ncbi:hypothetical protein QFZ89_004800 [Paraburkholderia youngii]
MNDITVMKKRILRRPRDRLVEQEVVLRADALRLDDALELVPCMLDRGDVLGVGLQRCLRGRARLGHDAKLIAAADIGQRFERREAAHVRVGAPRDGRARAVPRRDDAVGPQSRERFAHGRPGRGKTLRQRMLGRQPLAFLVLAFEDAVENVAVDLVG